MTEISSLFKLTDDPAAFLIARRILLPEILLLLKIARSGASRR